MIHHVEWQINRCPSDIRADDSRPSAFAAENKSRKSPLNRRSARREAILPINFMVFHPVKCNIGDLCTIWCAILKTGMVKEGYSSGESCRRRRVFTVFPAGESGSARYVMPPAANSDESRFSPFRARTAGSGIVARRQRPTGQRHCGDNQNRAVVQRLTRDNAAPRRRQWCRTSPTWRRRRAPVPGYAAQNRLPPEQPSTISISATTNPHIATGDASQLNYAAVLTETGIRERIKYR